MPKPSIETIEALLATCSFLGLFFVSLFVHAVRRLRRLAVKELVHSPPFYFRLLRFFTKELTVESILFCSATVQNILRCLLFLFCFAAFFKTISLQEYFTEAIWESKSILATFLAFLTGLTLLFIFCLELMPRLLALQYPEKSLRYSKAISSWFLLIFSPFSWPLYCLISFLLPKGFLSPFTETAVSSKEKLLELIRDVDDRNLLNEHDKKLLQSVLSFRDRIAREVMVPRINLFCLSYDTPIRQAAKLLQKEGYSRVPVYKNTQDHVIGVLMYKDILTKYMEFEADSTKTEILDDTIESITKHVLYTPETKKISMLLQEFRKKQTHLAVVVDEYGGTAGVVTIEDILEEIVGDIADEYDEEERQFWPLPRGGWIVDGRMNLLDLEDEIGIKIPQEGEYDTVAGYVYFRLGTIPKKGTILHHDDFELEILSSDDRFVEKVKITLLRKKRPSQ